MLSFLGFYWILLGFTGFHQVSVSHDMFCMDFHVFYRVLPGFVGEFERTRPDLRVDLFFFCLKVSSSSRACLTGPWPGMSASLIGFFRNRRLTSSRPLIGFSDTRGPLAIIGRQGKAVGSLHYRIRPQPTPKRQNPSTPTATTTTTTTIKAAERN